LVWPCFVIFGRHISGPFLLGVVWCWLFWFFGAEVAFSRLVVGSPFSSVLLYVFLWVFFFLCFLVAPGIHGGALVLLLLCFGRCVFLVFCCPVCLVLLFRC